MVIGALWHAQFAKQWVDLASEGKLFRHMVVSPEVIRVAFEIHNPWVTAVPANRAVEVDVAHPGTPPTEAEPVTRESVIAAIVLVFTVYVGSLYVVPLPERMQNFLLITFAALCAVLERMSD